MKYQTINPDEILIDTISFLDAKWDLQLESERENMKNINVAECKIYMRGQVWIVEHNDVILYYEVHHKSYPFFELAIYYMDVVSFRKWKTVKELLTFRQAIREATVQGTDYVETFLNKKSISERQYRMFLKFSRAHDLVHHGDNTF